ncbi:RNA-guided endonuclease InsQ/TnpB family protein [Candidatus Methanocrinis natronophilus]|uniref:RNA-guided endonuclease TnpB family protein n=1 Tax=Candidatus Methanocrinis natronophilus TaxID=3033396 RepID=A0ABT5XAF1_9EURY|nr:RNA-guided endonuclease TnpB family protein [Candidatus Methanocrinis natronophilus]MDF0591695.1 RNA-guided endonuclease TnpB family protein [Candidatus Methanocrinis natronophilus]
MMQTLKVKLEPTPEQVQAIRETMHQLNAACNFVADKAFELSTANKIELQKAVYYPIREQFNLSSQMAVRAISKTCEAYKRDKSIKPTFDPHGSVVYDQRLMSWKGLDLGIKNIAVDSTGEEFSGDGIENFRSGIDNLKADLQSCGTDSDKRHLKKLSGREARFRREVNHCISKKMVSKAKDTSSVIALEDLQGIREGMTVSKAQRRKEHSWGFYQLRRFVEYKATIAGVPVVYIDPDYTSQECPVCHHISRSNRPTRDQFACVCCGFSGPADTVAARNIAARVAVNLAIVARFFAEPQAPHTGEHDARQFIGV